MAVPDSQALMCYACKHEFTPEKPFKPLRIFLSYGRDQNEPLVRRIKADLEARGHDVWFDKSQIKFGDDWRRAITDGISGSNKVLSFLSKHSTRDPGVCLEEIAIALGAKGGNIQTILVEKETEVMPPPTVSHLQWLEMNDWRQAHGVVRFEKDKQGSEYSAGDAVWESWYQIKLTEIVAVIESEENRRFAGEIETLFGHLKPISSDTRISTLLRKGFIGRKWLFDAVEQWRYALDRSSRLFWITGAPGIGKSAFAANLTHFGRDKVIAAQFVEWDKQDHRDARRVVRSLAFQLATRLPDYRRHLLTLPEIAELDRKDPVELFSYLLAGPLKSCIVGGRARLLVVLDALDEAGEAGRSPLVEMLARHANSLPDWIGIVVTSRPESDVSGPLQGLNPYRLDASTEANRIDIRDYLHHHLPAQLRERPDADKLVEQILDKSEGVFLYAERFCDDVQQGHLSLDLPEQFPQGLGGIFHQWFQRQFPDLERFRKDVRPALRAILAAREPLPVEILQRLFNWKDEELRDFIRTLGSLFPVGKENGCEVIKPYHKSLTDWLTDNGKAGPHFVSMKDGHAMLAEWGLRVIKSRTELISIYWLRYALFHLHECGRTSEAAELASDKWFIEQRVQCGLKNIFVSYSLDATEIAERLFADLTRFGHTVWRHAKEGADDVHNALNSADLIIALLTRRSTRMRSWSYRETLEAVSQGKVVLPVRATSRDLSMPFHLRRPRYIDLSSDYATGLNELRQTLGEHKQHAEAAAPDAKSAEGLVERASYLASEGRFGESERLFRRALAESELNMGGESVEVAQRLGDLGQLLFATNRLTEAEPLMRRALGIHEKTLGENHPTVATALSNLALLLQSTNRLSAAEPLLRRALDIDEAGFGAANPSVAARLNNLAQLLFSTHRHAEAEILMRRALAIHAAVYGENHPTVATGLNNLALLLQTTNRLAEAEPLLRRALAIEEQSFGADHPDTATALNNLARLLQSTNRLDEAEVMMRRVLASYEQSYGGSHPNVASVLNTLGDVAIQKGDYAGAESLFRRALAIWESKLGASHPHVVSTLRKLSHLLTVAR
jgi:tetratricopeptide (TPR) repeat protein